MAQQIYRTQKYTCYNRNAIQGENYIAAELRTYAYLNTKIINLA